MNIIKSTIIGLTLLLATSFVIAAPVSFNFTQDGFDEGATIVGEFVGDDLNGDGQLSSIKNEITSFSMQFSGNSIIPSFTFQTERENGDFMLGYDLDNGSLGDGFLLDMEGIVADTGIFFFTAGPGPENRECGISIDCAHIDYINVSDFNGSGGTSSSQLILVSPVPIPASILLFISGLIGFIGVGRNKS